MRCPFCSEHTVENWQPFMAVTDWRGGAIAKAESAIAMAPADERFYNNQVRVQWMVCPNDKCKQIIIHIRQTLSPTRGVVFGVPPRLDEHWFALPRKPFPRPIDPLVGEPFRTDYIEAASILSDSPRMSATLSRRVLADLLEKYADRSEHWLASRIDKFIDDPQYPSTIKDNLHYLREIGDFGAHTQKDKLTNEIINASPEEAEWTLDVIDSLFEYFIVAQERNRKRREGVDEKNIAAGRKPIRKRNEVAKRKAANAENAKGLRDSHPKA